jgi:hypothetical protein
MGRRAGAVAAGRCLGLTSDRPVGAAATATMAPCCEGPRCHARASPTSPAESLASVPVVGKSSGRLQPEVSLAKCAQNPKARSHARYGSLAPLSACPLQLPVLPVHYRVSQLKSNPIHFQVRNFSTTETETQTNRINPRPLSFNCHCRSLAVGVERAPRTLPTRCVPRSSPIRPSACPSFRPRPATARP